MPTEKSILFVCTANIFRSVSAEYCFKQYLSDHNITGWKVGSAGTTGEKYDMDPSLSEALASCGVGNITHTQRKLSKEILDDYDIVVGMAQNHIDFLASEFGYKNALLFDTLAIRKDTSVMDVDDDVPDWRNNHAGFVEKVKNTVSHIHENTPGLFQNASERFYLFSDLISGEKTHRNGFPFISLYETPHTLAFMSSDIPEHADGHILIIPKKRFSDFSKIPVEVAQELFATLSHIGRVIGISHDGYNILLNNGIDAGQYIFHAHFHLVPRKHGDGIEIEKWNRSVVTPDEFIHFNEALKKEIASAI